mgnify:FL=1|jgi:hypothetical protein
MKMVSNVDCYRDDYQGEKPNWLQDLTPANYDDYEAIWLTVNFYDLTDMLFDVTETCDLGESVFEEETVQKYVSQQLSRQGYSLSQSPSITQEREAYEVWTATRSQLYDTVRKSPDYYRKWWDVLKPMTGPNLKSTQLVFHMTSNGNEDDTDWVDCTLYEQIEVDDFKEYPGSKLCPLIFTGLVLVDTAVKQNPYSVPLAYYVDDVEVDEDTVLDVEETVYEREWDKDSYYRNKYGDY